MTPQHTAPPLLRTSKLAASCSTQPQLTHHSNWATQSLQLRYTFSQPYRDQEPFDQWIFLSIVLKAFFFFYYRGWNGSHASLIPASKSTDFNHSEFNLEILNLIPLTNTSAGKMQVTIYCLYSHPFNNIPKFAEPSLWALLSSLVVSFPGFLPNKSLEMRLSPWR